MFINSCIPSHNKVTKPGIAYNSNQSHYPVVFRGNKKVPTFSPGTLTNY